MDQLAFSTAEREAVQYWRFHHRHPRVQRKMEVLYLRSQGVAMADICRLCAIAKPTGYRYLREYHAGGLEKLKTGPFSRRSSPLAESRATGNALGPL
jgi:transposase